MGELAQISTKMKPILIFISTLLGLSLSQAKENKRPVKVFVLAGQSNMQGKAAASTLRASIEDAPNRTEFNGLLQSDGKWAVRNDVFVTFLSNQVRGDQPLYGPLTIGYGSQKNSRNEKNQRITVPGIGPELGIGHVLGDHFDQPVLLIKAAWGGRSVKFNFRSPSSMPSEDEFKVEFAAIQAKRKKKPALDYDEWRAGYGQSYRDMIAEVQKVTSNISDYVPNYENRGFEIAGFIWFQGWNDGVGKGNPDYATQLAALIRDVRKDLDVSKLPVVIGELGVDGDDAGGWIATFRKQQNEVAKMQEFEDTVLLAETAQHWPSPPDTSTEWAAFRVKAKANESKPKDDPTRIDPGTYFFKNWIQAHKEKLKYTSDKRYHYLGSGECYLMMGRSMGKSMLELLDKDE